MTINTAPMALMDLFNHVIVKGVDINEFLWYTMRNQTAIFRQIMSLIFEPNSIAVDTYRIKGMQFGCRILSYQFTEDFGSLQSCDGVLAIGQRYKLLLDLAQLLTKETSVLY